MKTITLVIGLAGALAFTTAAFAAGSSDNSQASSCGQTLGAFADVNGNFGDIGTQYQGDPNYSLANHNTTGATTPLVGQETGAAGQRNSTAGTTCNTNPS